MAPRGETKPVGLIESFGALPQTPGRLRHNNEAGGSTLYPIRAPPPDPGGALPQTPGRLRRKNVAGGTAPDPRWGYDG